MTSTTSRQKIVLPDLMATWPWPRRINPLYHEVKEECTREFAAFNILPPSAQAAFDKCNFCLLASLVWFWVGKECLRSGCDLMNIFFLVDDITDELDEQGVRSLAAIIEDVFKHPEKPRPTGETIIGEVVRQFWQRALKISSEESQPRFLERFTSYLRGVAEEASERGRNYVRTIDEYWELRRLTIGATPTYALMEFDLHLPDYVINHSVIVQLAACTTDCIILTNDLHSYKKEYAVAADGHNIITIVMHQLETDIHGAMRWLDGCHRNLQAKFMEHLKEIPSWGQPLDSQVEIYVNGLASWIRTIDQWNFESSRYFGEKGLEIQKHRVVELCRI